MLLRSLLAALLIVVLTAGASATAALLKLDDILPDVPSGGSERNVAQPIKPIEPPPKPGNPQTILLVGSDGRWADKKNGDTARSDTLMLVRMDPDEKATTVLSLPRDLQVMIPGHGIAKINDAYAYGGPNLTAQTIKALTGLHIHHIVNVNFKGFREVVNTFRCFYADVDRRYYHSNVGVPIGQRYDAIDIQPGYQKLCGIDALDYVRFRHADSDLTRAARQQDFLRAAKDQVSSGDFLRDVSKLSKIVEKYTQTDKNLVTKSGFIRVAKLAVNAVGLPVRQIPFPATFAKQASADGKTEIDYVEATPYAISQAVEKFLHGGGTEAKQARIVPKKKKERGSVRKARLVDARSAGKKVRATLGRKRIASLGFPFRLPTHLTPNGRYVDGEDGARTYSIRDRNGTLHRAYRVVVMENRLEGQYYGVQGTTWRSPPFLSDPSATRTIKGRRMMLFRAGGRLRLIAWKTPSAVYWISNTLNLKLSNAEMLALAGSMTTLK
jgi:LCP family protein required for cell wall assembly